jgi:hypothetical protein
MEYVNKTGSTIDPWPNSKNDQLGSVNLNYNRVDYYTAWVIIELVAA